MSSNSRKNPPSKDSQQQKTGATKKSPDSQVDSRTHTFQTPRSNPKLVRSGNTRRPDLNATCLGPSTSRFTSCSLMNQSLRHLKTAINKPEGADNRQVIEREACRDLVEENCLLDYNNYLQALGKKYLVKSINKEHEDTINETFLVVLCRLDELKEVLKEIESKIALIDKKTAVIEGTDLLRRNVEMVEQVLERTEPLVLLSGLLKLLDTASENLSLINIKPFDSQEEFAQFTSTIETLKSELERIVSTITDKDEVNLLATKINDFMKVHNEIMEMKENILKNKTMAQSLLMKGSSDMFAKMNKKDDKQ